MDFLTPPPHLPGHKPAINGWIVVTLPSPLPPLRLFTSASTNFPKPLFPPTTSPVTIVTLISFTTPANASALCWLPLWPRGWPPVALCNFALPRRRAPAGFSLGRKQAASSDLRVERRGWGMDLLCARVSDGPAVCFDRVNPQLGMPVDSLFLLFHPGFLTRFEGAGGFTLWEMYGN